jgi:hypothetical protein
VSWIIYIVQKHATLRHVAASQLSVLQNKFRRFVCVCVLESVVPKDAPWRHGAPSQLSVLQKNFKGLFVFVSLNHRT